MPSVIPYPQNNVATVLPGTNIVLVTDPELETARFKMAQPLLREHAQTWGPNPFPYEDYPHAEAKDRCYDKAIRLATDYGLTYVEGFLTMDIPGKILYIGHGWCVDAQGKVVDPTAHKQQHLPFVRYVGVPIRKEYAHLWRKRMGYYGCLDGDVHGLVTGVYGDHPDMWLETGVK